MGNALRWSIINGSVIKRFAILILLGILLSVASAQDTAMGGMHMEEKATAQLPSPHAGSGTSWQPASTIRRLCEKIGPERLLFGSDFPLFSQKRALQNVRAALVDEEYEMVVETNAKRLLRIE